ncbi:MAG: hypothetical protein IT356_07420 [Gemmatimonadaceae bacterium]|nr:hypothetical protein [Gemmatimonadaceae bacterium]
MLRAAVVAGAILVPGAIGAQGSFVSPGPQGEARIVVAASPHGGIGAGVGVNVPAGYYVRAGPGVTFVRDDARGGSTILGAEVTARFLLDPFRESRWGAYAGAGLAAAWRDGCSGRAYIVLQAGVALPGGGSWERSLEVDVAGGLRAALVLRPARARGR